MNDEYYHLDLLKKKKLRVRVFTPAQVEYHLYGWSDSYPAVLNINEMINSSPSFWN